MMYPWRGLLIGNLPSEFRRGGPDHDYLVYMISVVTFSGEGDD